MKPPDMSCSCRALGIDLGGASSPTTGYAVIDGDPVPRLESCGILEVAARPIDGEVALLRLIDLVAADVLAVDAPLTLPPCLTCPSYCRGPDLELCELGVAREMWATGSNPTSQRPCEIEAKRLVVGLNPQPTMGLGIITARAVALARKLTSRGIAPASIERGELLEVYPRATLIRLGQRDERLRPKVRDEDVADYRRRLVAGLCSPEIGLEMTGEDAATLTGGGDRAGHALDAVIAAYTGWLGKDRLEPLPEGFNLSSGWIWFPR